MSLVMNSHAPTGRNSAVILAGGRSSRMGRAKALLPFDGEPLIAHVVRSLEKLFVDIVVVTAPDQELPPLPVTLAWDDVAYQGPVSGIYHGLTAAKNEVSFVGSCDMPFASVPLIAHLISQIDDYDVVVPEWGGRYQPLFAVYRSHVASHLAEQLRREELRPIFLFDKVRTRKVGDEEIRRYDPDGSSFINMNTPADYHAALERWRELHTSPSLSRTQPISCTVELLGVARLRAKIKTVSLELPGDASLAQVLLALSERLPNLVGPVIAPARDNLVRGQACNINGREFVRDFAVKIHSGDRIFIVSADAGG